MLREYIPLIGDKSTQKKVKEVFTYLDKKISFQFLIYMFLVEGIKSTLSYDYIPARNMFICSLLSFLALVLYKEYGKETKEAIKKAKPDK